MTLTEEQRTDIAELLARVHERMKEFTGRSSRNYGTDTPLYDAEIKMIQAIKESPNIHVTALSTQLGISKSAVSQIITRLFKKGMVTKGRSMREAQSKIALGLTEKGLIAYTGHMLRKKRFEKIVGKLLREADAKERRFLADFLVKVDGALEQFTNDEID